MSKAIESAVAAHYGRRGLLDAILTGLEKSGVDPENLAPENLAPVDEFHTAGRLATQKALAMIPLKPGMHVLDAGCGIGGTARVLAAEHRCRVTGIDLTPEYIDVARDLTGRMKLAKACEFREGSVTDMPFPNASFDAGVSFHVAMNIADRSKFYGELARVLRPGSSMCIFDVMKGPSPGMIYPVPWAETEETSFLKSRDETCDLMRQAGFDIAGEQNLKDFAFAFFQEALARAAKADGPPPLGLHLLTGANTREKFGNYVQALTARQIEPVILVATRT